MPSTTATNDRKVLGRIAFSESRPAQNQRLLDAVVAACVELCNEVDGVNHINHTLKPWDDAAVRDWLTDGAEYRCLTAVDARQQIVGVQIVSVNDQEGYVLEVLGVHATLRRRGLGRQLVNHAISTAAKLGFRVVDTRVFVDNTPMIVLLLDAGFVPTNLSFRARADGCDLLWMSKYLGP